MTIGLEAKGYRESETRAGKRHRNSQKIAKRDERVQELSHKASLIEDIYVVGAMRRVQLKRSKGFKMPPNAIYVGRPTKWGNPFRIGVDGSREGVIAKYREWLNGKLREDPDS
jgi:hypothetical protein